MLSIVRMAKESVGGFLVAVRQAEDVFKVALVEHIQALSRVICAGSPVTNGYVRCLQGWARRSRSGEGRRDRYRQAAQGEGRQCSLSQEGDRSSVACFVC